MGTLMCSRNDETIEIKINSSHLKNKDVLINKTK